MASKSAQETSTWHTSGRKTLFLIRYYTIFLQSVTFPQAVPYTTYMQSRILSVGSLCFKLSITFHYVLSVNHQLNELDFIACILPTGIRFVLFTSKKMTCSFNWRLRKLGMSLVETLELPQLSYCWIFVSRLHYLILVLCFCTPDRNIISTYNCQAEK